jgi:AraC-like DNA-binding protein
MLYNEYQPCPALVQDLECIWFALDADRSAVRAPERVLPDGCCEWIFHLGTPFQRRQHDGGWENQATSFFVGELTRFLLLQPSETISTMGVRFRPTAAYRFLPISLHVLTDDNVSTRDIWGAEGRDLEERVLTAGCDAQRKALVEDFLIRRREKAQLRPRFEVAVCEILSSQGQLRVDQLATKVGWSRRQLEREFRSGLGVSPKVLARIIRFQNLLRLVGEGRLREWATVALAVGYSDQPHMVREFREFSGQSPTAGKTEELGDLSRHFVNPRRLAMLLGKEPHCQLPSVG